MGAKLLATDQGRTILLVLSESLPKDVQLDSVVMHAEPLDSFVYSVERSEDQSALRAKIIGGSPTFQVDGVFGQDPSATGIGCDLGDGVIQWVDLR